MEGLDGAAAGRGVLVSVHTVDEIGSLKTLAGSSEEAFPSVSMEWEDLSIETTETELAIVVHSVDIGPIGFAKFFIDPSLFTSTVSSRLVTEIATFSRPTVTARVTCIPAVLVRFSPARICVADVREEVFDPRTVFQLQMDIMDESKVVASVKSVEVKPEYIGLFLALVPTEELKVNLFLTRRDIDKLKAEIYVIDTHPDREPKLALIDCIPLKHMRLNEPVLVGSAGEGQLVLVLEREPDKCKWLLMDQVLKLQRRRRFQSVHKRSLRVLIQGLDVNILKGSVNSAVVGYGFHSYLVPRQLGSVEVNGDSVELSIGAIYITHDPPVLAISLRDRKGELRGLYSIPLVRSDLEFPNESVKISVFDNDENESSFLLPLLPEIKPTVVIDEYSTTRVTVSVDSAVKLPRNMNSVFCSVRVVGLSVPPTVLSASEVLRLDEGKENPMGRLGNAITATRESTRDPLWYHLVAIDVYQWIKTDWLYFTIFDATPSGSSELVAHACVQLNQLCVGYKELTIPLVDAQNRSFIQSCFLKVSFPSAPESWSTLYITQPPGQYIAFEGELCLQITIYPRWWDSEEPIKEAHHWLPISDVYPLMIHNCPPSGLVKMKLSLLNGKVVAKSKHRFTIRDNDSMSCGGIKFLFSRRLNS